jgi:hypothetical protein
MMGGNPESGALSQEHVMRKVLRGYAKGKDGDLILVGAIPVRHSKDKPLSTGTAGQMTFDQARGHHL